jgi:hypothetical protein
VNCELRTAHCLFADYYGRSAHTWIKENVMSMSKASLTTLSKVLRAVSSVGSTTTTTLSPGPGSPQVSAKAAIRRCCNAWQRAYDTHMNTHANTGLYEEGDASAKAAAAYCNAMPLLTGYQGICDFIACVAHGILIGAIHRERGGQLLYAAQVAISSIKCTPRTAVSTRRARTKSRAKSAKK